jgi:hypothetical protein
MRFSIIFNLGPMVPKAQRRFSPSEAYAGTLYKVKQAQRQADYKYPVPPAPPGIFLIF